MKKEFEALKPYVCKDPLCLFQYITMGFGPSIEHEILSQPYVVDLLVTLCYSSIQNQLTGTSAMKNRHVVSSVNTGPTYPIREFPTRLRLKVASLPPIPNPVTMWQDRQPLPHAEAVVEEKADLYGTPIKVLVDFDLQTLSVRNPKDIEHLTGNSWAVLRLPNMDNNQTQPQVSGAVLDHQVYLKYVDGPANRIDFETKHVNLSLAAFGRPGSGPLKADLYRHDFELDDLDDDGKARAMTMILSTVPPISHLREYLINHPHSRLRSYHGISSSAATLLEWIVASNRSFIIQVNQVDDIHALDMDLLKTIKTRDQEVIPSLSLGCVQFRLAMGNPDKELGTPAENNYPTLFAWHGSALQNWHSILRQGLDFNKIANGRAYGDGVYLSTQYATSQVCTGASPTGQLLCPRVWLPSISAHY